MHSPRTDSLTVACRLEDEIHARVIESRVAPDRNLSPGLCRAINPESIEDEAAVEDIGDQID